MTSLLNIIINIRVLFPFCFVFLQLQNNVCSLSTGSRVFYKPTNVQDNDNKQILLNTFIYINKIMVTPKLNQLHKTPPYVFFFFFKHNSSKICVFNMVMCNLHGREKLLSIVKLCLPSDLNLLINVKTPLQRPKGTSHGNQWQIIFLYLKNFLTSEKLKSINHCSIVFSDCSICSFLVVYRKYRFGVNRLLQYFTVKVFTLQYICY